MNTINNISEASQLGVSVHGSLWLLEGGTPAPPSIYTSGMSFQNLGDKCVATTGDCCVVLSDTDVCYYHKTDVYEKAVLLSRYNNVLGMKN